jgi:hypothetical protein
VSVPLRFFLLGVVATLGPSIAILALSIAAAWYRDRKGRRRAVRELLRDVRQELAGR